MTATSMVDVVVVVVVIVAAADVGLLKCICSICCSTCCALTGCQLAAL